MIVEINAGIQDTRFWKKVDIGEGHWLWTAYVNQDGYGCLSRNKVALKAHRYAWELATGDKLTGHDTICHTCDIPNCVRNDDAGTYRVGNMTYPRRGHLYRATQPANVADRGAKGRGKWATGEKNGTYTRPETRRRGTLNGNALIADTDVVDICWKYVCGESATKIARTYGLANRSVVFGILKGTSWTHVSRPTYEEIKQLRGINIGPPENSGPCIDCGMTDRKRIAKGLCERCYKLRDRRAQGIRPMKGATHSQAKLSESDVLAIRAAKGEITGRALANRFNISPSLVTMIQQHKIWTHI